MIQFDRMRLHALQTRRQCAYFRPHWATRKGFRGQSLIQSASMSDLRNGATAVPTDLPTNPSDQDIRRLRDAIERRRAILGLSLNELAAGAHVHVGTVRRLRDWEGTPTPETVYGVEATLGWEDGSIAAILRGGDPTHAPSLDGPPAPPPGDGLRSVRHGADVYYWLKIEVLGTPVDISMVDFGGQAGPGEMERLLRRFG